MIAENKNKVMRFLFVVYHQTLFHFRLPHPPKHGGEKKLSSQQYNHSDILPSTGEDRICNPAMKISFYCIQFTTELFPKWC